MICTTEKNHRETKHWSCDHDTVCTAVFGTNSTLIESTSERPIQYQNIESPHFNIKSNPFLMMLTDYGAWTFPSDISAGHFSQGKFPLVVSLSHTSSWSSMSPIATEHQRYIYIYRSFLISIDSTIWTY